MLQPFFQAPIVGRECMVVHPDYQLPSIDEIIDPAQRLERLVDPCLAR